MFPHRQYHLLKILNDITNSGNIIVDSALLCKDTQAKSQMSHGKL